MKERFYPLIKGTLVAFTVVNTLIGSILAFLYPDFFSIDLLLSPGTLILTLPLSLLFYLNVKYLKEYSEDSETEILDMIREVDPDLGN